MLVLLFSLFLDPIQITLTRKVKRLERRKGIRNCEEQGSFCHLCSKNAIIPSEHAESFPPFWVTDVVACLLCLMFGIYKEVCGFLVYSSGIMRLGLDRRESLHISLRFLCLLGLDPYGPDQ